MSPFDHFKCSDSDDFFDGSPNWASQKSEDAPVQNHSMKVEEASRILDYVRSIDSMRGRKSIHPSRPRRSSVKSEECTICYMTLEDPIGKLPRCRHSFCAECITSWLHSNSVQGSQCVACPLCREEIESIVIGQHQSNKKDLYIDTKQYAKIGNSKKVIIKSENVNLFVVGCDPEVKSPEDAIDEDNEMFIRCNVCLEDDDGEKLCCDACDRTYHLPCVGLQDPNFSDLPIDELIPSGMWYCDACWGGDDGASLLDSRLNLLPTSESRSDLIDRWFVDRQEYLDLKAQSYRFHRDYHRRQSMEALDTTPPISVLHASTRSAVEEQQEEQNGHDMEFEDEHYFWEDIPVPCRESTPITLNAIRRGNEDDDDSDDLMQQLFSNDDEITFNRSEDDDSSLGSFIVDDDEDIGFGSQRSTQRRRASPYDHHSHHRRRSLSEYFDDAFPNAGVESRTSKRRTSEKKRRKKRQKTTRVSSSQRNRNSLQMNGFDRYLASPYSSHHNERSERTRDTTTRRRSPYATNPSVNNQIAHATSWLGPCGGQDAKKQSLREIELRNRRK